MFDLLAILSTKELWRSEQDAYVLGSVWVLFVEKKIVFNLKFTWILCGNKFCCLEDSTIFFRQIIGYKKQID